MANADESLLALEVASLRPGVDAEAYLAAFRRTLDALATLNRSISEFGSETVEWQIVAASMRSPLTATLEGVSTSKHNGALGAATVERLVAGVRSLETSDACPFGFDEKTLADIEQLLAGTPKGISSIKLARVTRSGQVRDSARVSRTVTTNARNARERLHLQNAKRTGKYVDYGTLEGRLLDLMGKSDRLVIVDELTGKSISCYFTGEEQDKKARQAWKGRVSVSGEITYDRATGDPVEMKVDDIRLLRDSSQLPQLEDFVGLNITGGLDSAEFVRGLRDGD